MTTRMPPKATHPPKPRASRSTRAPESPVEPPIPPIPPVQAPSATWSGPGGTWTGVWSGPVYDRSKNTSSAGFQPEDVMIPIPRRGGVRASLVASLVAVDARDKYANRPCDQWPPRLVVGLRIGDPVVVDYETFDEARSAAAEILQHLASSAERAERGKRGKRETLLDLLRP